MGLGAAIRWMSLGRRLSKLKRVLQKEGSTVDVKKVVGKGVKGLALGLVSVVITAALAWLSDPVAVTTALSEDTSPALVAAVVPIVTGLAEMARNAWKHRASADPARPRG